ncbi:MAG: ATP-dependent helicase [bacterium]
MAASGRFEKLNERQREAATFGAREAGGAFRAGPLLIIAGAGTGKTNTLAHRVAHLIVEGASPERILLLTFTRRAAAEMGRRAQRIVAEVLDATRGAGADAGARAGASFSGFGGDVRLPWSGTFHAIANRLIRRHCHRLGLAECFSVLDRGDAADLMDVARHERGLSKTEKRFPRKDTCLAIYSHRVNTQRPLAETLESLFPWCADWEEALTGLFREYVERKLANQALDYDDLLLYWHAMMHDADLAPEIGGLFDHILVDEYQDTNALQSEILKALRPSGEGVTVVGDDAQSIYSFRAATVENILRFPEQYAPPATVVTLEENYRSTQGILDAANALIGEGARQYRKTLRARRGSGARPNYVTVPDDAAQARYIVEHVLAARENGVMLRRQAVLFRTSHHSDVLELELMRRNIPYVKYGGLKFLEAAHVKDLLAVLRWADNPRNRVAAWRALQIQPGIGPGISSRVLARFEASAFAWSTLRTTPEFDALMIALGDPRTPWPGQVHRAREWYEPQLERLYDAAQARAGDLQQLERISAGFETRERFLTELALDPPDATGDLSGAPHRDEDYLVLSTVHSAKGQEWDAVYVLNVADGNFPNEHATGSAELTEEERRLLYVAMTRAKNELHLIAPLKYYVTQQSRVGDRHVYGAKSRFLTKNVTACLDAVTWGESVPGAAGRDGGAPGSTRPPIDVATKLREMWS